MSALPPKADMSSATRYAIRHPATTPTFDVRSNTLGLLVGLQFPTMGTREPKYERLAAQFANLLDGSGCFRLHVLAGGRNLRARHGPREGRASACIQGNLSRNAAAIGHYLRPVCCVHCCAGLER